MQPDPQETDNLVTFTKETLNRKLHFCAVYWAKANVRKIQFFCSDPYKIVIIMFPPAEMLAY